MGIARGVSETLWLVIDYVSLLSFSKRNIYHVELVIEDVDGKGSFGESSAVAATPWEVGTIVTVIVIDNIFYASVSIYLSPVLLGLLTVKTEVEFVI